MRRQLRAGLHPGHHGHGHSHHAGDDLDFPAQWPGPVLGGHPAGHSWHDARAGAVGVQPRNAGNVRDLRRADRPDRARDGGGAGHGDVGDNRHDRTNAIGGIDRISRISGSFRVHG